MREVFLIRNLLVPLLLILTSSIIISEQDEKALRSALEKNCQEKLNFKTIHEFREFVDRLRQWDDLKPAEVPLSLARCLSDKEPIYELENLVLNYDKMRPCKLSEITKLENYAIKYLMDSKKPISVKFFTLFGVNVGFYCKLNLLAHLQQADTEADQVDFIRSMASPVGWDILINEHTKKSLKFGTSSSSGSNIINRVAKMIPGLSQIEHLDYMYFNHPKNELPDSIRSSWQGIEKGVFSVGKQKLELNGKLSELTNEIIESCKNLDQFYTNSVLALARLNNLGLLVEFDMLDDLHGNSHMLHKWLAAASFCQLMIRVRAMTDSSDSIKLEILHDDNLLESRRRLYSYVAKFEEIHKQAVEKVWLARLSEGRWRKKSQAMFRSNEESSTAMKQLKQFLRGLERDYTTSANKLE